MHIYTAVLQCALASPSLEGSTALTNMTKTLHKSQVLQVLRENMFGLKMKD